jgi:hypothetical protein
MEEEKNEPVAAGGGESERGFVAGLLEQWELSNQCLYSSSSAVAEAVVV